MTIPTTETIEKAKKGLASRRPAPEATQGNNSEVDLKSYLSHYGVSIIKEKNNGHGMIYVLKQCPFNPEHNSGEVHASIATDGTLGFACKHNSCASYNWHAFREKISGQDSLTQFMAGHFPARKNSYRSSDSTPTMPNLREYLDLDIEPGQSFSSDQICRALGAHSAEQRNKIYQYLARLKGEGVIKKEKYAKRGLYRRVVMASAYDLGGDIQEGGFIKARIPLALHELIKIMQNQIISISGMFDAGKTAFLFHLLKLNYEIYKIIHFSSPELDPNAIKKRLDLLSIPRTHPNILCYPMDPGYEDLIPDGPCLVLVDYLRTNENPHEIDIQYHRIFDNLKGGVAFTAIQKHPGIDRPVGGQFAVHAPQHVILLDNYKSSYICKILKTKNERDLKGVFIKFKFDKSRCLTPTMKNWKKGDIIFNKPTESIGNTNENDISDISDTNDIHDKEGVGKWGGPHKEKESNTKKEKEPNLGLFNKQETLEL